MVQLGTFCLTSIISTLHGQLAHLLDGNLATFSSALEGRQLLSLFRTPQPNNELTHVAGNMPSSRLDCDRVTGLQPCLPLSVRTAFQLSDPQVRKVNRPQIAKA